MLAGGAESSPPAESPRWRLRELDPSTPGPPGSATLGCLPYALVCPFTVPPVKMNTFVSVYDVYLLPVYVAVFLEI